MLVCEYKYVHMCIYASMYICMFISIWFFHCELGSGNFSGMNLSSELVILGSVFSRAAFITGGPYGLLWVPKYSKRNYSENCINRAPLHDSRRQPEGS